ncbi:MAG: cation transporter [Ruminococcaceae bacterium]|nr:cation transporter [Oscillospiraceae bacterium]
MTDLLCKLFIKNPRKTADAAVRRAYGTLASIVGILVNTLLFGLKFTVGTLFHSVAIRADAINNISDAGSQLVSLISFRISSKPADREHPFGHARMEYVTSLIVSFLILHVGLELLTESVVKIFKPEPPTVKSVTVWILLASIGAKLWLGLFNRTLGRRIDSSVMRATAADAFSDCLSTGAILISTLVMLLFPQWNLNLDAYMGVIVAILILISGVKILLEAKDSLLGGAPSEEVVRQITEAVEAVPQALGIHDLEVHNYGPGHIVATLHVEVDGKTDVFETHDMIDALEQRLRREWGILATIHMDPIVTDNETVNRLRELTIREVEAVDPSMRIHDFRMVQGPTHTNLIFDVAVPFELPLTEDEVKRAVADRISRVDPSYFTVITVDRV